MTGHHTRTIIRLLLRVGDHCDRLIEEHIRGVRCRSVQVDETWTYVAKKQRRVTDRDPWEYGDAYVFIALDPHTKLVPCYLVGKRDLWHAHEFMRMLSQRIAGRTQISVDGYGPYPAAIRGAFNGRVDAAKVVKTFGGANTDADHRYSPPSIIDMKKVWIAGRPRNHLISTSHVERNNLTLRMQSRRFTRLTNAFSKTLDGLQAAVALHYAWYNFVRIHRSLRTTPAVSAKIASAPWRIEDLIPGPGGGRKAPLSIG
ncbi:MAG: DDE-type integrase/transposase/recombinase [Planctomycetes bacterium]|nr:DDE-type integrase/transposase/recombinase [Planctomycetota bacterium]